MNAAAVWGQVCVHWRLNGGAVWMQHSACVSMLGSSILTILWLERQLAGTQIPSEIVLTKGWGEEKEVGRLLRREQVQMILWMVLSHTMNLLSEELRRISLMSSIHDPSSKAGWFFFILERCEDSNCLPLEARGIELSFCLDSFTYWFVSCMHSRKQK